MSKRNVLRYGSLAEVQQILEERTLDPDEVRAVLLNVLDNVRVLDRTNARLAERVAEVAPEVS